MLDPVIIRRIREEERRRRQLEQINLRFRSIMSLSHHSVKVEEEEEPRGGCVISL